MADEGAALQLAVEDAFPKFSCENECCSEFSPGPVGDDEDVAFLLIHPLHFDEQRGTVVPDAFQELFNRDLSVLRLRHTSSEEASRTREELIERGLARVPPKLRMIDRVCVVAASSIRSVKAEDGRALAIYDTALKEKPGHASVFTTKAALTDKLIRKRVRALIHEIMTKDVRLFEDAFVC